MGWHISFITLFATVYIFSLPLCFKAHAFSHNFVGDKMFADNENLVEHEELSPIEELEDEKLEEIGLILERLLVMPWPKGASPLLYVENYPQETEVPQQSNNQVSEYETSSTPMKRSRYYRKYPWKRQNSRYDAENRYLCQPSKDDVFRLLVALHEARQGNRGKTVNFCNRKRPAGAIFTNIRFLGK